MSCEEGKWDPCLWQPIPALTICMSFGLNVHIVSDESFMNPDQTEVQDLSEHEQLGREELSL